MTINLTNLLNDAIAAGYTIERDGSEFLIVKRTKRTASGLRLCEDGTAFDLSLRLDVAKGLRSYKSMRKVLGV